MTEAPEKGWRLAGIGAGIVGIALVGPRVHKDFGDLLFMLLVLAQGAMVLWALQVAGRVPPRRAVAIIIGFAVLMRLALLFVPPHLSSDAFRYVWDGRVQGAGINPYRYVPAAAELAWLRDAAIFPFINRADYAVTIYPPAAQILFFLIGRVADGMVAMKLGLLACEALTVALLMDLLRRLGRPPLRILVWLWHPLALWEIAGSAHIDAAMVAAMMLGVWIMAVLKRPVAAAATIAVGAMMKPLAALALPFVWRPWDWRAPLAAVLAAAVLFIPYLSVGTGIFAFYSGYLAEEEIATGETFFLLWLLERVVGPIGWAKAAYGVVALALLGFLALRVSFTAEAGVGVEARLRWTGWLVFAALFALSPGYGWYYLCLLPFLALFGGAAFWAATLGSFLFYDEVHGDPAIAFWIRDAAMQGAVLLALAWGAARWLAAKPRSSIGRHP